MLILLRDMGITPDLILFADTGGEKPHTYKHVEYVSDWCESVGFPRILTVKKRGRIYVGETLEENCIRLHMLPSLAYGFKSCSQKYKIQPQDMFVNNWGPAKAVWADGLKVVKYIGYDADEIRRAKIRDDDKYNYVYPLISADWGREECIEAIVKEGLSPPGKSACFFCPASTLPEIRNLREQYPDLLARAIVMECNAELTSVKGLGRRFSWKAFIDGEEVSKCQIEQSCGCYDG